MQQTGIYGESAENTKLKEQEEQLEYIIRYIRLILQLSVQDLQKNPRKTDNGISFVKFYRRVGQMLESGLTHEVVEDEETFHQINELLPDTLALLSWVYDQLRQSDVKNSGAECNNRTNWIRFLNEIHSPEAYLAEAIVDLCYNYTVESSISSVSRHYSALDDISFEKDFSVRLQRYWNQYKSAVHFFGDKDKEEVVHMQVPRQNWIRAVRVIRTNKEYMEKKECAMIFRSGEYETEYENELRKWRKTIWKSFKSGSGQGRFKMALLCLHGQCILRYRECKNLFTM